MKLYYVVLTNTGATVHVVEDYDRHKIWVKYPNAKEISKKVYDELQAQINNQTNNA